MLTELRLPRSARATRQPEGSTPFILAGEEVAFVGEPVAIVVAESRYVAEDAASLVAVEYEPLAAHADARQAAAPGAAKVRNEMPNVLASFRVGYGDTDAAFKGAAHIFRQELWQHRGSGHPLEGRGVAVENRVGGGRARRLGLDPDAERSLPRLGLAARSRRDDAARAHARCRRRLRAQILRLSRGCRRRRGIEAARPLARLGRGPARAFPRRDPGARPVSGRSRSRSMRRRASAASAARCCTTRAPMR